MRKKPVSVQLKSRAYYKDQGFFVETVERRLTGFIKKDFLEFADLYAFKRGKTMDIIQVSTMSNRSAHLDKLKESHSMRTKLYQYVSFPDNRVIYHWWRKLGKANKRKLWELKIEEITFGGTPEEYTINEVER